MTPTEWYIAEPSDDDGIAVHKHHVEGSRLRFTIRHENPNEFVVCFANRRQKYCSDMSRAIRAIRLIDKLWRRKMGVLAEERR